MIGAFLFLYTPRFARVIVYMLQATEYDVRAYLSWIARTNDFRKVMYRRSLVLTRPSKMLLLAVRSGLFCQILIAIIVAIWGAHHQNGILVLLALALAIIAPPIWAILAVVPLWLGKWLIVKPYYKIQVKKSSDIFATHPGLKIAIAGSYGKTTMKEILKTVLSECKKVAATPANRNVAISHAQFVKSLKGDEEVLIIEFGEGAPGDVMNFSRTTHPNKGIITGLAPAHLDKYKNLQAAGEDIFSLATYLNDENVYVNQESGAIKPFIKPSFNLYSSKNALGWKINNIHTSLEGTTFSMSKKGKTLKLHSKLLGQNQVGPISLAAAIGGELGLTFKQIQEGIAKTKPFEHRMQPRPLAGGWLIDDTYNGNIEGMKAGLNLLSSLKAKRKIYVTPGLVDQGQETENVHTTLGYAIADSNPSIVVLMQNSVTDFIEKGLKSKNYKGELRIEDDPLNFYTNLEHFIAAGDLVLMQNDWPDNYN